MKIDNWGRKLQKRAKEGTRFKVKTIYVGWFFIAASIGLIIVGGMLFIRLVGE